MPSEVQGQIDAVASKNYGSQRLFTSRNPIISCGRTNRLLKDVSRKRPITQVTIGSGTCISDESASRLRENRKAFWGFSLHQWFPEIDHD